MRPVRIELEGFSAYRTREVVDLGRLVEADTAFFSLTGATGAGKSSLVDAMIFALYGRIPRLGAREVAPVISAGADRSRVRLDFQAGGDVYTVVREVRRTKTGGASVKEARLQIGDRVLSDGAASVTEAVEELLGLGFEDFTRTVVLPQGDFARFLHATPAERQNLLRGLLGLDMYARVRTLAGERRAGAQARADAALARLEGFQPPGADDIEAMRRRLRGLEGLAADAPAWEDELTAARKLLTVAIEEGGRLEDAAARLAAMEAPPRLEELSELVSGAVAALHAAEDAHRAALEARRAIEMEHEGLPEPGELAMFRKAHQERLSLTERLGQLDLDESAQVLERAQAGVVEAEERLADARRQLDEAKTTHAAHALASDLAVGDPCPVCRRTIDDLPALDAPEELSRLEAEAVAARDAVTAARDMAQSARDTHTVLEARRGEFKERLAELDRDLADAPALERIEELESQIAAAREQLAAVRAAGAEASERLEKARKAHEDLLADHRSLGRILREAQQSVADLKPPIGESDDIGVQWKELLAWRDETLVEIEDRRAAVVDDAEKASGEVDGIRDRIAVSLADHGIDESDSFRAAIATEVERARQALERAEALVAEAAELSQEESAAKAEAQVAKALADHLRADGFEKWMMAGALHNLVLGANGLLAELSDGGYSLHAAEGAFAVVDHRNADELRPVSTLSGGETFLVSLALALSLAEIHASHGDARLEAVILDEGFGTLDEETLDTVASLLEELAGNRGLMVGVITHVKELAERASVRFEVVRGPRGSNVREVA
jgi:DNA repair protein SbcC/Rad50